jgi:hypothetical protein
MIMTNKLLPVALIAALIGGSVGAFVMHSRNQSTSGAETTAQDTSNNTTDARNTTDAQYAQYQPGKEQFVPAEFNTPAEQTAYKAGFTDGFNAATQNAGDRISTSGGVTPSRVNRSSAATRRVYYDYRQPRGRSFWQKHRDKLTVAMGTGGGALVGGLIGGKKGAAIGALSGAGGSALYTYKLRKRSRSY